MPPRILKTADLCDAHAGRIRIASPTPVLRDFGHSNPFRGQIATVRCFEDNSFVRKTLETDGRGRVLVVDGGASMRCALLGDKLAELAIDNEWEGVIVNGCIRDSEIIRKLHLGVKAIGTHPRKSEKKRPRRNKRPGTLRRNRVPPRRMGIRRRRRHCHIAGEVGIGGAIDRSRLDPQGYRNLAA